MPFLSILDFLGQNEPSAFDKRTRIGGNLELHVYKRDGDILFFDARFIVGVSRR